MYNHVFLCKVYLVLIILLITSPSFSQEKIVPTYSDFLKIYPNGYPEYSSKVGNSKSIGAYQEYLDDIGFITLNSKGKRIGFRIILDNNSSYNDQIEYYNKIDLADWGNLISEKITENLSYPSKAKNRNISGKVEMYLSIKTSGEVLKKYLTVSSGHKSLDMAVLNVIENIEFFPKASFHDQEINFDFIIPFEFKLE